MEKMNIGKGAVMEKQNEFLGIIYPRNQIQVFIVAVVPIYFYGDSEFQQIQIIRKDFENMQFKNIFKIEVRPARRKCRYWWTRPVETSCVAAISQRGV